jgi:DNA mismatch endonuclease (patch repair protein)
MDKFTKQKRSEIMSRIRGSHTKPERIVRSMLHSNGYRYRLHNKKLIGTPDIVLKKYQAVIFVHGCFWHGHDCQRYSKPKSNKKFWIDKVFRNQRRDKKTIKALLKDGWRVSVVWECALKPKNLESVFRKLDSWIQSRRVFLDVRSSRL